MKAESPQRLLDPVDPPIAVHPAYIRDTPTTLVMKQKVFNTRGDDFIISDTNGNDVLRCVKKGMSFKDKKVLASIDHVPLYALRGQPWSLLHKTRVEDGQGAALFSINEQWSWASKFHCTIDTPRGAVHLTGRRKLWTYAVEITMDDGTVVATIGREYYSNTQGMLKNRETFYVTVAPGVDLSLMAVMCLSYDDLLRAQSRRHSS